MTYAMIIDMMCDHWVHCLIKEIGSIAVQRGVGLILQILIRGISHYQVILGLFKIHIRCQ